MASTIKVDTIQSTTSNVFFQNSVGTEYARFDSTGVFQLANPSSFAAGTAAAPSITATGDTNTGIFFPAADTIGFSEGGAEIARFDSSGNFGLGVTPSASSISGTLQLKGGGAVYSYATTDTTIGNNVYYNSGQKYLASGLASFFQQYQGAFYWNTAASGTAGNAITFTQAMTLDSSGRLSIGTTSASAPLHVQAITGGIAMRFTGRASPADGYSDISFFNNANTTQWAGIGAANSGLYLATNTTIPIIFQTNNTERMRLDSSGNAFFSGNYSVLYPGSGNTTTGIFLESDGQLSCSRDNTTVARFNRNSTDGTLLSLSRQGTEIGTVSVSSGTVSYNAFAGSHWSQLSDGSKPVILRGTVLDSINELVQWPNEPTTERLCKVKVSDTAGSKKVYGVFMDWDNDWTVTNDMYVTAVGAFICRVNASVTVQEGDLLESNGDGTARVQSDDLIRSSTIGKVTCTEKTHQYDDGSYCVPTVLYCG